MPTIHISPHNTVYVVPRCRRLGLISLLLSAIYLTQLTLCAPTDSTTKNSTQLKGLGNHAGTLYIPLQRLAPRNPCLQDGSPVTLVSSDKRCTSTLQRRTTSSVKTPDPTSRRQNHRRGLTGLAAIGRVGYAGHVLIGTPPQRFSMLFDTGSDLALVTSDDCLGDECPLLAHYSCKASSTCMPLGGSHEDDGAAGNGSTSSNSGEQATSQAFLPHNRANAGSDESFVQLAHSTLPTSDVQRHMVDTIQGRKTVATSKAGSGDGVSNSIHSLSSANLPPSTPSALLTSVDMGDGVQGHPPTTSLIPLTVKVPRSQHSSAMDYNQSYVDGTWGVGYFVQDHFQIDIGHKSIASTKVKEPSTPPSSALPTPLADNRPVLVTFLNVVQDNLDLVDGYDGQIAGLLGLSRASPTGHKTFLEALVAQGSLAQPVMSMHLEDDGGSFLLGGIDAQAFIGETLYYSPVTDPIDWQISLQGLGTLPRNSASTSPSPSSGHHSTTSHQHQELLSVGTILDPNRTLAQISAILDSGASAILAPLEASETLHHHLGGYRDPTRPELWILPCEGPDLVWWLSEVGVVQPYENLIYRLQDERCQSLIFESTYLDYWVLGDTWLRGLYVAYDMAGQGRIGMAVARWPKKAAKGGHKAGGNDDDNEGDSIDEAEGRSSPRVRMIPRIGDRVLTQTESNGASRHSMLSVGVVLISIWVGHFITYLFFFVE